MIGTMVPNFWSNTLLTALLFGLLAGLALTVPEIVRGFDPSDTTAIPLILQSRVFMAALFILPSLVFWLPSAWFFALLFMAENRVPWLIGMISSVMAGTFSMWLTYTLFRGLFSPVATTEPLGLIDLVGIVGLLTLSSFAVWTLRRADQ